VDLSDGLVATMSGASKAEMKRSRLSIGANEGRRSGAKEAAEKGTICNEISGARRSGAKALADSVGFMRGLKPPPPSVPSFSAAYKAQAHFADSSTRLQSCPDTMPISSREEDGQGGRSAANSKDPLALLLLGPTGSGKTALSLALGERFGGEIVSCDSVAVYRGMDVGTAKPSPEEQVRVAHHLIDVAEPDKPFTAGEYSRHARAALRDIAVRGRLPIVTGGTGLYLRALTEGLFAGPERQNDLRERLNRSRVRHRESWLHRLLERLDPASAARIHANDAPKLIRAIEVCLAARMPMSEVLARDPLTGFSLLRIGLNPPRAALYAHLNRRCTAMFAAGLVEETRGLLSRYGPVKALDSLGYRQALAVLAGEMSEESAIAAAQQGHRNYAKRQITWFRREPDVNWIEGFGGESETIRAASDLVQSHVEQQGAR
jgi:tRNA dimethylallyltransferase